MTRKFILAAGVAAVMAFSASAAMAQDKNADKDSMKFIKNAIEGNYAEVDAGKLAQDKGKSDAVKKFGAMLVKDHGAANDRAIAAAKQLGIDPPTGSGMTAKAEYLKLKVLSGDTFDRSFAKGMISDHTNDVKEYQTESSKSDAVGSYAKETLPTLQKHLTEARSLVRETTTTGQGSPKQ